MYFLVSYDVHSDFTHYRTSIARILLDYGLYRIQYSVFLGKLRKSQIKEIMTKINAVIKKECPIDVRFFSVCQSCISKSYLISRDRKTVGFVVSSMTEAIKSYVSYLKDKKAKSNIDKRGWIDVYEREMTYEEWKEQQEEKIKQKGKKSKKKNKGTKDKCEPDEIGEIYGMDKNNQKDSKVPKELKDKDFSYVSNFNELDDGIDDEIDESFFENLSEDEIDDFIGIPDLDELCDAVSKYYADMDNIPPSKEEVTGCASPSEPENRSESISESKYESKPDSKQQFQVKPEDKLAKVTEEISEETLSEEKLKENSIENPKEKSKGDSEEDLEGDDTTKSNDKQDVDTDKDLEKLHYTISDHVFFF